MASSLKNNKEFICAYIHSPNFNCLYFYHGTAITLSLQQNVKNAMFIQNAICIDKI